ncbi:HAD family hydrolase [Bacillus horti]|uniref:Phosphoglycolate phosphatase n=1 Tax=Caldalkalibacillus horti TaxID=77523 RepID=A0ABT9W3V3_9BACI|nr:HAD family hydrolase [Bacillus horti]MDQ0167931.1 phosphoglycolate phosphatase [Bacillus horti]
MDSIIFDLDGTLWDSTDMVLEAWNHILQSDHSNQKSITKEEFQSVVGMQVQEIGKRLFPNMDETELNQFLEKCNQSECDVLTSQGGVLYDRLESVLKALSKKYKLFIVSNCQAGYIEAFYAFHQLEKYFVDYENPGRTGLSKGENIKLVIERNNLQAAIYVGDTEGDQKAAEFAGIPFVYARYGFGQASRYDFVIDRLDQLVDIL